MKQIPRFWARTTGEKKGDLALHQKRVEVKRSQPIVEALFEDAVVLITGAGSGMSMRRKLDSNAARMLIK